MSGIAGIYYLDSSPVVDEVDRMVEAMKHRGPDGVNVWKGSSVGLGHCMLVATPEDQHESLPFVDRSENLVITADARIDNRENLIESLEVPKYDGRPITDSELILASYKKWGKNCPQNIIGAFSFAIWDKREDRIFCARDHFGVKPLYYYEKRKKIFAFGSEIKSLFKISEVPKKLDKERIGEHLLAPVKKDITRTYFKRVNNLAPAHKITVEPENITSTQYWSLDPTKEINLRSDREYEVRFRKLFRQSVRARLRSVGPIGSTLSGGLDSSSIVSQAAQLMDGVESEKSLHTFSVVFDKRSKSDERTYINTVLNKYDSLEPHFIRGDKESPMSEWDEIHSYLDGACSAGNVYMSWRVNRLAQNQNVRVLLDGFDGDTTISHGLGFLKQLREEGRWLRLAREVVSFANTRGESPRRALWSWVKGPLFSLPVLSHLVKTRKYVREFISERKENNVEAGAAGPRWKYVLSDEFARQVDSFSNPEQGTEPVTERENHYQLLVRPLLNRYLNLRNYMGSSAAVDVRFPFFDKRLVEYCLALPPEQKLRKGWSRFILRRGMENILPSSIQWRKDKSDLSVALDSSITKYEQKRLQRLRRAELGNIDRFVSAKFLDREVPRYLRGEIDTGGGDGIFVWRALSLAFWLQRTGEAL